VVTDLAIWCVPDALALLFPSRLPADVGGPPDRQGDLVLGGEGGIGGGGVLEAAVEWKITPVCGSQAATGLARASATSSVRK
jgi:hypothetical protein